VTLGMRSIAVIARMTRASLQEALQSDFIRTARAKGLGESRVVLHHGLRNALLPVITVLGLDFGSYLTGSILTETIFSWPGVGPLRAQRHREARPAGRAGSDPVPERALRAGEPVDGPGVCKGGPAGGV
jgi:ABC-type dipeptide/oligopeptide/nickel transport system permease component